jgi:mRNA-degrading endonuclease RelE of RelBE toxin-antitoxin system
VSEEAAPERTGVIWSPEARADLRTIERGTAMQILHCVDRYLASRTGDVKKLKPPFTGFWLHCGDYRVFFDPKDENAIEITGVRNRREAYR